MHNTLESDKKIPERLVVMQESVEKNANLMLACSVVVMLSWFAFAPDSIPNIYTNVIGTWAYTAIDLLASLRVHEFWGQEQPLEAVWQSVCEFGL